MLRSKCGILRSTEVCLPTRSGSGREIEFSRICAKIIAELRGLFLASKLYVCMYSYGEYHNPSGESGYQQENLGTTEVFEHCSHVPPRATCRVIYKH